ncbi:MAG: sugar phosphate isomerase/epimerase family protein [Victivallaceae bacterium]
MKYSFMSFSTPALTLDEMFATARRYGYAGIEPRIDSKHAHGIEVCMTPEQRKSTQARIAGGDIKIACLATSLSYADPAKTDDMITQTHERIDLAGDLAIPVIRVFGGKIPEGISREKAIDLLVSSLLKVADYAEERGVAVCLETHDDWCNPEHVAAVMQQVNHAAIRVNWDIMHPARTGKVSIKNAFDTLKPWIRHVHIHDGTLSENLQFVPIGAGDIDHRSALELLKSINFNGYLSGEWINWEPYDVHLPREIAIMKNYEKNL